VSVFSWYANILYKEDEIAMKDKRYSWICVVCGKEYRGYENRFARLHSMNGHEHSLSWENHRKEV
jgi:hypothetical protein